MIEYMELVWDILFIEYILIDLLDFVFLVVGLGLKMGFDVIIKWDVELLSFVEVLELEIVSICFEYIEQLKILYLEVIDVYLLLVF